MVEGGNFINAVCFTTGTFLLTSLSLSLSILLDVDLKRAEHSIFVFALFSNGHVSFCLCLISNNEQTLSVFVLTHQLIQRHCGWMFVIWMICHRTFTNIKWLENLINFLLISTRYPFAWIVYLNLMFGGRWTPSSNWFVEIFGTTFHCFHNFRVY